MSKSKKNDSRHSKRQPVQKFTPAPVQIPAPLFQAWLDSILASVCSRPQLADSLDRANLKRLIRSSAQRIILAANAAGDAEHKNWEAALGLLRLKIEVGHGCILPAMEALEVLSGGRLKVRTVNHKTRVLKVYLESQLGQPITIATLRKQPGSLDQFDFKKFYAALESCGSQKAFLEKHCGARSDDTLTAQPSDNTLAGIRAEIDNLATRIQSLPVAEQQEALNHAHQKIFVATGAVDTRFVAHPALVKTRHFVAVPSPKSILAVPPVVCRTKMEAPKTLK